MHTTDSSTITQPRPKKRLWFWLFVVPGLLIAAIIATTALLHQIKEPSVIDLARERNQLRMLQTWGEVWPGASIGLFILFTLFLVALGSTLLVWLREKATSNYADDRGLFPVKALRAWKWVRASRYFWLPMQAVIYHDPNRAPGATTIYAPTEAGEVIVVKQVTADDVSPEQIRITQGAQLAQIAAAASSGKGHNPIRQEMTRAMRGQIPQISIYNEMDRPLVAPQLPPVRLIEGSHIERLLQEQGELPQTAIQPDVGQHHTWDNERE
jgi:hypothetical protein